MHANLSMIHMQNAKVQHNATNFLLLYLTIFITFLFASRWGIVGLVKWILLNGQRKPLLKLLDPNR